MKRTRPVAVDLYASARKCALEVAAVRRDGLGFYKLLHSVPAIAHAAAAASSSAVRDEFRYLCRLFVHVEFSTVFDHQVQYWRHRQLHRSDGPAVEWRDGSQEWRVDGQQHRSDGPAVHWVHAGQEWWLHDKRHRDGGEPAIDWWVEDSAFRAWFVDGKRHRAGGPAVEYGDGTAEWWIDDECVSRYSP